MPRGRTTTAWTITLTPTERATLQAWQRAAWRPAGPVRRARIVLLRAAGMPMAAIGRTVGVSRKAVYAALRAWQAAGLAGLQTERRGRRGAAHGPERAAGLLRAGASTDS